MKLVREIPIAKLSSDQINNLEQFGFTLVFRRFIVEVWAHVSPDAYGYNRKAAV